ncbi:MAG TPA: ABC transporter substrate-binding protein, partial [Actinomycetota bacterium]|nr:ABC transporter substrate-binding protein [Actinomycetota bacterium]
MKRQPVVLLAVLALLASACGSRLSNAERTRALAVLTGSSTASGGGTGSGATGIDGGGTAAGGDTGSAAGSGGGGAVASGGSSGGAGVKSCAAASKATDTGVTAKSVTVATLADVSGVQPGLFQSAHQAARAASAYINSQGGICGRQVEVLPLDSKTDAGGNRSAMLEACDKAFAVVGSMSAFDEGSAKPGQDCGIPDM